MGKQMSLSPYPSYKPSGIPWLGDVPEHWEIKRLGAMLFDRREKVSDKDFPPLSVTKKGILPQLSNAAKSDDGDNRKKVCSGDFVINSRSDRKGSSGLSDLTGSVSLINTVLIPNQIQGRYTHTLLKSIPFQEEFYRMGRGIVADLWSTQYAEMRKIMIPIPSTHEQTQIARFLDWKTSQINKFIKAKKRIIELLKEQIDLFLFGKIHTSDLNIFINWESSFPESWEMVKAKRIFFEVSIRNQQEKELLAVTQDRGVVYKKDCVQNYVSPSGSLEGLKLVRKNDFVISLRSFQGGIEFSNIEGIVSPAYNIISLNKQYNILEYQHYFKYLFKTKPFISQLNTIISGIRDGKNINFNDFAELLLPVPPIDYINSFMHLLTNFEFFKQRFQIEKVILDEYKSCLIADVVTGKIDIRGIEVPEVIEDIIEEPIDEDIEDEIIEEEE